MGSAPSKCLPPYMEQFCNDLWLSHGLADKTIAAYRADLIGFSSWLSGHNGKTLLQAQILDIDEWLASLLERKISPRSVARYSASLRRFYRYLTSNGLVSQDPTVPLGKIKIPRKLPNTPTQDEVATLLDITDLNSHQGLRDKALLELLYATGLRAAELSGLEIGDIDFRNRVIRVCGKGNKERLVVYGEEASFWLDLYLSRSRPAFRRDSRCNYVFLSVRGKKLNTSTLRLVVKKHAENNSILRPLSTHSIRHAFATHLLDAGADLRVIQKLLGHACISTTQIYTFVATKRLVTLHAKSHPRNNVGASSNDSDGNRTLFRSTRLR
ncbi:MAG: tyrosine recombinase [Thiobacillus sp.]|nr:tyrosine recombinase [Thiobacillus sp.]